MEPDIPRWYIAVVTPNTEKSCEKKLHKWASLPHPQGPCRLETYVPQQRSLHEQPESGRKRWVTRVVCPCFLFVRCTERVRYAIKAQNPFVLHFLKDRATRKDGALVTPFAVIPDPQMQLFRQLVSEADTPVTLDSSGLQIGSRVLITRGKLQGMTGYLVRQSRNHTRFCIKIDLLGYATVDIDASQLEEIPEE